MSVLMTAQDAIAQANRRIVVTGPKGSGKTSFSVSASRMADGALPAKERIVCTDTLVIQGDEEGIMGAVDAGLEPGAILNMTDCNTWNDYQKKLAAGLKEALPKFLDGTFKFVVIDLGLPDKLINQHVDPSVQKDWKEVANEGGKLYRALSGLRGVTVIANCQLKAASSPGETQQAIDAANAKAIGGERSTFAADLQKGVYSLWAENASLIFAREVKRVKAPDGSTALEYLTHTQSGPKFEAKARFRSVLKPVEKGVSLRALLNKCYNGTV